MFKSAKKAALVAAALSLSASSLMASDLKLNYSGYLDANYQFNADEKTGSFNSHQFGLDINAADDKAGAKGVLSLVYQNVTDTNYNNYFTQNQVNATYDTLGIDQAFVEKSFGDLDVKLGKFYTFVGYEVAPVVKNANHTNSLLFGAEPLNHEGILAAYSLPFGLSVSGLVANNSVVSAIGASSSPKNDVVDYGAQVGFVKGDLAAYLNYFAQPVETGTLIANYLTNETGYPYASFFSGDVWGKLDTINFVSTYKVSDTLSFAAEYNYRTLEFPSEVTDYFSNSLSYKDQGYSLYSSLTLGSVTISPRFTQYFVDVETLSYFGGSYTNQINQYTLTAKYKTGAFTAYVEGDVQSLAKYETNDYGNKNTKTNLLAGASYEF